MAEKRFKVSKEEYQLLQLAKVKNEDVYKKNMEKTREWELKNQQIRLNQIRREINFKEKQLKDGKILEIHADFVDGKKPDFFIVNDIENLEFEIEKIEEAMKNIKEAQDADKH